MKVFNTAVNTPNPVKIKTVVIPQNHGKHFVIGPREADKLRNRVLIVLFIGNPVAILLDTGEQLDENRDIEVLPLIQMEIKFWV